MQLTLSTPARTALIALVGTASIACSAPEPETAGGDASTGTAGMMSRPMPMMAGGGMMGGRMGDMRAIHSLLANHQRIERSVEDIPNGVRTVTTSRDPRVAELIRTHVRQMRERLESGIPIRRMDPLFRELFERRHEARLEVENIPGGVRVLHTSDNPEVVRLIRQHARHFVSEAAARGMRGAMGPTPLPEGYRD